MIDFLGKILEKINSFTDKFFKLNKDQLITCRICGKKYSMTKGPVCSPECDEKYQRDMQGKLNIDEALQ